MKTSMMRMRGKARARIGGDRGGAKSRHASSLARLVEALEERRLLTALPLDSYAIGAISAPGGTSEFTFHADAGKAVTITVDARVDGTAADRLGDAHLQLWSGGALLAEVDS